MYFQIIYFCIEKKCENFFIKFIYLFSNILKIQIESKRNTVQSQNKRMSLSWDLKWKMVMLRGEWVCGEDWRETVGITYQGLLRTWDDSDDELNSFESLSTYNNCMVVGRS